MSLHNFKFEAISADGRLHDTRVVRAMQTLQADPALSADDLASMLQLSTSRFQHLFKMQMGVSVTSYAREVRLHRALYLLETTWLSVKQIRNDLGISDASHFARDFRMRFGISPSAYRDGSPAVLANK